MHRPLVRLLLPQLYRPVTHRLEWLLLLLGAHIFRKISDGLKLAIVKVVVLESLSAQVRQGNSIVEVLMR